jgi:hypothetical protein
MAATDVFVYLRDLSSTKSAETLGYNSSIDLKNLIFYRFWKKQNDGVIAVGAHVNFISFSAINPVVWNEN